MGFDERSTLTRAAWPACPQRVGRRRGDQLGEVHDLLDGLIVSVRLSGTAVPRCFFVATPVRAWLDGSGARA